MLRRWLKIPDQDWKPAGLSFAYFFFLMSGYFIMRPVRDEMGILAGIENLQWLFTGTFITMLIIVPVFGFLTARVPRNKLIPMLYVFFLLNILGFYLAFQSMDIHIVSMVFFIWLSVYNLFVVSIFWSFNSDIFSLDQAKRLYGPIAAGGSAGAIIGPAIAMLLVGVIGTSKLLLVSAAFLYLATICILRILNTSSSPTQKRLGKPIEGSIWEGLKSIIKSPMLSQLTVFILLFTTISTFIYFQQAHIVSEAYINSDQRTAYFGARDLTVNSLTLIIQFFLTQKVFHRLGVRFCLMIVPIVAILGFLGLGLYHSIYMLFAFQVLYRSLNFSIQKPAREILFTRVTDEERYKSKNFIDTAVYRGGDAMSGWLFTAISSITASLQVVALLSIPIAMTWLASGSKLGKIFRRKIHKDHENIDETYITKKSA